MTPRTLDAEIAVQSLMIVFSKGDVGVLVVVNTIQAAQPQQMMKQRSLRRGITFQSLPSERIELEVLARVCGRDRWSLSRDFRQFFGTSPSRYVTMR